eukprot:3732367-Pyramimonas_sp.AAC.1
MPTSQAGTRGASSTRRTEKLLTTTPKIPGAVPSDKDIEIYSTKDKKHQDFDISAPRGTPRTPRGSAGASSSAACAATFAAPASKAAP